MKKIRVLLADDHSLFREGLASILNAQPDFEVIGEAGDGLEVLVKARELMPDLILMDINMPGCDGLEATEQIKHECPSIIIVMLTVRDEDEKLFQAIRSGAQGYLLKNIRSWEMVNLLRGAVQGEAAITSALAGRMLEEFRRLGQRQAHTSPGDDVVTLTARERDILSLVATCATDKEIADQLCISVHTVKSHMRNILAKLQLGRRHEAALFAMREGLIRPPNGDSQRAA
jgi:DNA-binding NarL/FixJ family response regulator